MSVSAEAKNFADIISEFASGLIGIMLQILRKLGAGNCADFIYCRS